MGLYLSQGQNDIYAYWLIAIKKARIYVLAFLLVYTMLL